LKYMGSKKIARYIRNVYGIIVNHKKLHRLRKKLGLVGKYKRRERHPYTRSRSITVTKANQLWEADITFVKTREDGNAAILNIIDVYDRSIVGTYVGKSCKKEHFIQLMKIAITKRAKPQIIRTDNGSQFKALDTGIYMNEENIIHEFGIVRNPDSQAFIESSFSSLKREFVRNNEFKNLEDLCEKLKVYLSFYNNLRPHGSLKYQTPRYYTEFSSKNEPVYVNP